MLRDKRVLAALGAVVLVVAVVVVAVLVRGGDTDAPDAAPTPSASGSPSDQSTEHEHDPIDEVDPDIDPADYVDFCEAFYVFANAYSSAAADGDPGDSPVLKSAADSFRAVAADTDLTDEVRAGLDWFVDDALRIRNDATTEEQNAFSTFLNSACPA